MESDHEGDNPDFDTMTPDNFLSTGYIGWRKDKLTPEKIERIHRAAQTAGLDAHDNGRMISAYMMELKSGASYNNDIVPQFSKLGPERSDRLIKEHGGFVQYTDEERARKWNHFTNELIGSRQASDDMSEFEGEFEDNPERLRAHILTSHERGQDPPGLLEVVGDADLEDLRIYHRQEHLEMRQDPKSDWLVPVHDHSSHEFEKWAARPSYHIKDNCVYDRDDKELKCFQSRDDAIAYKQSLIKAEKLTRPPAKASKRSRCRHCDAVIQLSEDQHPQDMSAPSGLPLAVGEWHEGTDDDPRPPGDWDDICDVCNYGEGKRGGPKYASKCAHGPSPKSEHRVVWDYDDFSHDFDDEYDVHHCPTCDGKGETTEPHPQDMSNRYTDEPHKCHSCGGTGLDAQYYGDEPYQEKDKEGNWTPIPLQRVKDDILNPEKYVWLNAHVERKCPACDGWEEVEDSYTGTSIHEDEPYDIGSFHENNLKGLGPTQKEISDEMLGAAKYEPEQKTSHKGNDKEHGFEHMHEPDATVWLRDLINATPPEKRKSLYRELSKAFHPDTGGDPEVMQALNATLDEFADEDPVTQKQADRQRLAEQDVYGEDHSLYHGGFDMADGQRIFCGCGEKFYNSPGGTLPEHSRNGRDEWAAHIETLWHPQDMKRHSHKGHGVPMCHKGHRPDDSAQCPECYEEVKWHHGPIHPQDMRFLSDDESIHYEDPPLPPAPEKPHPQDMGADPNDAIHASLREKLQRSLGTGGSGKMAAIAGHIMNERWTDPAIRQIKVTSDGYVMARLEHDIGLNEMLGGWADLHRNWNGLLDHAQVTDEERQLAKRYFRARIEGHRVPPEDIPKFTGGSVTDDYLYGLSI